MLFVVVRTASIPAPTMFVMRNHGLGSVTISLSGDNALCEEYTLLKADFFPAVKAYFCRLVVLATFDAVCPIAFTPPPMEHTVDAKSAVSYITSAAFCPFSPAIAFPSAFAPVRIQFSSWKVFVPVTSLNVCDKPDTIEAPPFKTMATPTAIPTPVAAAAVAIATPAII